MNNLQAKEVSLPIPLVPMPYIFNYAQFRSRFCHSEVENDIRENKFLMYALIKWQNSSQLYTLHLPIWQMSIMCNIYTAKSEDMK